MIVIDGGGFGTIPFQLPKSSEVYKFQITDTPILQRINVMPQKYERHINLTVKKYN